MSELNSAEIEQLDRASTAGITIGIVTPIAAMVYGFGSVGIKFGIAMISYLTGWLLIACFLHYLARLTLRRLA